MDGDLLVEILGVMRRRLADANISPEQWTSIEQHLRGELGGRQHYIARRAKGTHLARLEAAAAADEALTAAELAQKLGVSVRRVRQLKALTGGGRGG